MDSRLREVDAPTEPADGAAALATAKVEVEVTKPRNDRRGYRRVVLPNALECLLISDPDTDKVSSSRLLALQSGRAGGFVAASWFRPDSEIRDSFAGGGVDECLGGVLLRSRRDGGARALPR